MLLLVLIVDLILLSVNVTFLFVFMFFFFICLCLICIIWPLFELNIFIGLLLHFFLFNIFLIACFSRHRCLYFFFNYVSNRLYLLNIWFLRRLLYFVNTLFQRNYGDWIRWICFNTCENLFICINILVYRGDFNYASLLFYEILEYFIRFYLFYINCFDWIII